MSDTPIAGRTAAGFFPQHWPLLLLLISGAVMLGGCMSTSVDMARDTSFPIPLVTKVPLTVGLHLPEELLNYSLNEDHGDNGKFSIDIGDAQRPMFLNLFTGMFTRVELVDDPTIPSVAVAGTLVPTIAEMQFSTPLQTRTDYFEVWIRYQMRLYSRDGVLLGDWPLTAYGKANTQNYGMNSTQPTLHAAALQACRDAMAFFTVQFPTVPQVQNWLAGELSATAQVDRQTPVGKSLRSDRPAAEDSSRKGPSGHPPIPG